MKRNPGVATSLGATVLAGITVITVWTQSSTLSFGVPASLDLAGAEPAGRAVGDFNRDGHLDVLATIAGAVSANVKLAIGDGVGRFTLAPGFSFPDAGAAAAADFNRDGALDVVIAQNTAGKGGGYADFICGSVVGVAIFLGPDMASSRCLATVPNPVALQTGDFDRDGRPDIAVVSSAGAGLKIYRQLDFVNHTVTIGSVPGGELRATSMAVPADVNGDGLLDLAIGHATGATVFRGAGDGTFAVSSSIASADPVRSIVIAQFDADGVADLAFVQVTADGLFAAFGNAAGTFTVRRVATVGANVMDVAAADLNTDASTDLVVAHKDGAAVRIFLGNGSGMFVEDSSLALGTRPKLLVVADLDGDNHLDLGSLESGTTGQTARLWTTLQGAAPDVTPPDVRVTAPAAGATVGSTITIAASASDARGISRVEFYAGSAVIGTDTTAPYSTAWNTTTVQNGSYTLTARAYDSSGNIGISPNIAVIVSNGASTPTPVELIVSGGFEPTVSGWTKTGAAYFSTGGVQHAGVGYGYLAKANAVTGTLSQTIDIPAGATASLSFWLNVTSSEPSATVASDELFVEVLDSAGVLLQTIASFSNLNKGPTGAYVLQSGLALSQYAGQKVRLRFRAVTNAVNVTAFRIDDVSVIAMVPRPPSIPELIVGGGFEPPVTGWTKSGVAYFSTGGVQHTGIGYGYLAKANSVTGSLQQQITIAAGSTPSLSFWLNVTSAETSTTAAPDKMYVEVLTSSGALLATLATYSNLDKGASGAYVLKSGLSLAPYAGQTVWLRLRATTDALNVTAFRIDDVSVK